MFVVVTSRLTRTPAAHHAGIELLVARRDLEERSVLRAFFDIGELGGHLAVSALDGEVKFLVDPERFFLAAFFCYLPFIACAAVDGLDPKLLTGCALFAEAAGIAVEVFETRHPLQERVALVERH